MSSWSSWWEQAQAQASEIALKAQVIAEQAGSFAQEKANILAKEIGNLDFDNQLFSSLEDQPSRNSNLPSTPAVGPCDLIYVTENVLTMSFPHDFSKKSVQGGNDINAAAAQLTKRHPGHFMIWNISEEQYDYSKFDDQVLEYKFPGHPSPPLGLVVKICTSVESWLDADEKNVAIIHCLTGKGRTTSLVACILSWMGEFQSPSEALQYVADRRNVSISSLTIPSQQRYIQYFSNMLDGVRPRSQPVVLKRIIFHGIPIFGNQGDNDAGEGCCPYLQLFKCGKLLASSFPVSCSNKMMENTSPDGKSKNEVTPSCRWVLASEDSLSFTFDGALQGDILLRCRHIDPSTGQRVSMFRTAFHTGYLPQGVLRLNKSQLDGATNDLRFDEEFFIDIIYSTAEDDVALLTERKGSTSGENSVESLDTYESNLHKDTRFWDAVASRKSRSKKRKQRRFPANLPDQFSIADDMSHIISDPLSLFQFSNTSGINQPSAEEVEQKRKQAEISDEERILQLAESQGQEHGNFDGDADADMEAFIQSLTGAGSAGLSIMGSKEREMKNDLPQAIRAEIDALDELEKVLGLDDNTIQKTKENSSSSSSPSSKESEDSWNVVEKMEKDDNAEKIDKKESQGKADDFNLDEIEQYLESLGQKSPKK